MTATNEEEDKVPAGRPALIWPWPTVSAVDRLSERAAAHGHARLHGQNRITNLRHAVRKAVLAELPRGQHAPANLSRIADLQTDLIVDALLIRAAALYPTPTPAQTTYRPGRPPRGSAQPRAPKKPRGHPRATLHHIAGRAFIEQWQMHFPECGRGRGARGRAQLRDEAAKAFLALLDVFYANPRNLLKKRSLIADLPSN
jgi:hypothetical protein